MIVPPGLHHDDAVLNEEKETAGRIYSECHFQRSPHYAWTIHKLIWRVDIGRYLVIRDRVQVSGEAVPYVKASSDSCKHTVDK